MPGDVGPPPGTLDPAWQGKMPPLDSVVGTSAAGNSSAASLFHSPTSGVHLRFKREFPELADSSSVVGLAAAPTEGPS